MNLLLTPYQSQTWISLTSLLGLPSSSLLQPVQSMADLKQRAKILEQNQILWIGYVQAEYYLADAVEQGAQLDVTANQWQQLTQALLTLQAQNRRQLKLFNLHQALETPTLLAQQLPNVTLQTATTEKTLASLNLLAACQYVAQTDSLKQLNVRLQASALPLAESELITLDVEQILLQTKTELEKVIKNNNENQIKYQEQIKTLETSHKDTSEERDLILQQLHLVQEELERYYNQLKEEEQRNKHTLLARDKQHARDVTRLEQQVRQLKARVAGAEYAGQLLQQELNKLKSSRAWKGTAPVRALKRLIKPEDKSREKLQQETGLLLTSEYFDVDWYLGHYPDIAESDMNPAEHYLLFGGNEGRMPGPLFDGNWYLQQYPDVAEAGINPLLHFVMFGQAEGRNSSPVMLQNAKQSTESEG